MKIVQLILASSISMLIINNINAKYKLFKRMQSKINNFNEKRKRRLSFISYVVIILIYAIMQSSNMSFIIQGLIFGVLFSIRDICFGKDLDEYRRYES
ncbi:MAG: hypothetical protein SPD90_13650 [Intestinibacter sp.]|uniref:hypothetical protein n=1 Tax=Intestinibacter sp. TaxID=1965304 RepID=UPI002A804A2A|nr:hypothetical protein [Intestinibacter sp.]MDY4576088.1 hypothetical protein [Intestinibacter sp.]